MLNWVARRLRVHTMSLLRLLRFPYATVEFSSRYMIHNVFFTANVAGFAGIGYFVTREDCSCVSRDPLRAVRKLHRL